MNSDDSSLRQQELFSEEEFSASELISSPNPMVRENGSGPEGASCRGCAHLYGKRYNRIYYKCGLRGDTNGPGTDHRVRWPACARYKEG